MDKILHIDTYKSGRFYFSLKFQEGKITEPLTNARSTFYVVNQIPILPDIAAQLDEELIKKSIFSTAALEGNPLSEEEVGRLLSEGDKDAKMKRFQKQIVNIRTAYDYVKNLGASTTPFTLTEDFIRDVHRMLTDGSDLEKNNPGQYRSHDVKVGDMDHGGVYVPPKILEDIKLLMKAYIDFINSGEVLRLDPALRAALAHYYFSMIHPFGDGNGRTARVVEATLLRTAYIKYVPQMMSNFYYKNIDEYYLAFSQSEKDPGHDISAFLVFFVKGLEQTLNDMNKYVMSRIRIFTLKHYYESLKKKGEITQRQHDLLILLIEGSFAFSLRDLFEKDNLKIIYRNVTERTARRDVKNLIALNLLLQSEENTYILNRAVLG